MHDAARAADRGISSKVSVKCGSIVISVREGYAFQLRGSIEPVHVMVSVSIVDQPDRDPLSVSTDLEHHGVRRDWAPFVADQQPGGRVY
jgi:hypothetical protein